MKKYIAGILSLGLVVVGNADIIRFNLSPAGTEAAVGLSALNEVPASTNSTGSGNALAGGINFDTASALLSLAVGYGSAAGFTDLTAPATAMHLHGPAGPGTNAGVVVDLMPLLFTQTNPALGGIIFGKVPIPTNQVDNLLAGLLYLNIHTTNYPGGEIRGQLIAEFNRPPVVVCPVPSVFECGGPATATSQVSDPDGDALVIVWSVNGAVIKTNELAAGTTTTPTDVHFSADLPLGTNTVSVAVTDSEGNTANCSTTITVVDTIPPVITKVTATPNLIWPPNHKIVAVQVAATVTDVCGATSWKIVSITCNETVDAKGSGNTATDWAITGTHTANVRSERSGKTGPRIYTLTVQATDAVGNVSTPKTVTVTVPHDLRSMGK